METSNFETHAILKPRDCKCDGERYCNICDGGLAFCTVCHGGERELYESSCGGRILKQQADHIERLQKALDRELGHCKRHNTFFDEEPCWQCVNEQVAKLEERTPEHVPNSAPAQDAPEGPAATEPETADE